MTSSNSSKSSTRPRSPDARVIELRLARLGKLRPRGFLVREAPTEDVRQLKILLGHLQAGQFLTKFRKTFTRDEMGEDLVIIPAKVGKAEDQSEYEEILPTSPSRWYLTGFLVPNAAEIAQRSEATESEQIDSAVTSEGDDDRAPERPAARRVFFPSSMGLSGARSKFHVLRSLMPIVWAALLAAS